MAEEAIHKNIDSRSEAIQGSNPKLVYIMDGSIPNGTPQIC